MLDFKTVSGFLLVSGCLLHAPANGQVVEWTDHIGGPQGNLLQAISSDSESNIYVAGTTQDTTFFFSQSGLPTQIPSTGFVELFLAKYNSSGNLLWSFLLDDSGAVNPISVTADSLGNVLLSGDFSGTVDFDPNQGQELITSTGLSDGFLAKYSSLGEFIWVWTYGGDEGDAAGAICTDPIGNIYLTGGFTDTLSFVSSSGSNTIGVPDANNFFLAKLTSSGGLDWIFSPGYGSTSDLKLTPTGNLVLGGNFCDSVDFDPGPGLTQFFIQDLGQACQSFIVEYDSNGGLNWVNDFGIMNYHNPPSVAISQAGNVYVTGRTYPTESSPSTYHCYVSQFDSNGAEIWQKWIVSQGAAIGNDIAVNNDRLVIAIQSVMSSDFDPGPLELNLTCTTGYNPFICEWTTDGDLIRVNQLESSVEAYPSSLFLAENGSLVVAGNFIGAIDLGEDGQPELFESSGWFDSFLMKLNLNTTTDIASNSTENDLTFYSDPVSGLVRIDFFSQLSGTVRIWNNQGQLIAFQDFESTTSVSTKITGTPGIYIVELISDCGLKESFKILKQ